MNGQLIKQILLNNTMQGWHRENINDINLYGLSSGVYFIHFTASLI